MIFSLSLNSDKHTSSPGLAIVVTQSSSPRPAMEKTLVLYFGFGVGHLSPMLELSKLLLRHGGGVALDVVVLLIQPPFGGPSFDDTVARGMHQGRQHVCGLPRAPHLLASDDEQHEQAHNGIARIFGFPSTTNAPLRERASASFDGLRAAAGERSLGGANERARGALPRPARGDRRAQPGRRRTTEREELPWPAQLGRPKQASASFRGLRAAAREHILGGANERARGACA